MSRTILGARMGIMGDDMGAIGFFSIKIDSGEYNYYDWIRTNVICPEQKGSEVRVQRGEGAIATKEA